MNKIPVTVLTGFLGSGKTTLLNYILSANHGKRIAVIENEFGEIGVDHEIVIGADEEIFEMNNGCICCTVRGDLIRILNQLLKRKDRFDYILIETTGMANPAPVAQTFWADEELQEAFELDGIVTLVDAHHFLQHVASTEEVKKQVAFADVVLLNKTDLVDAATLSEVEQKIKGINAQASIQSCTYGKVDLDSILNIKAFNLEARVEINPNILKEELPFEAILVYNTPAGITNIKIQHAHDPVMEVAILPVVDIEASTLAKARQKAVRLFSEESTLVPNGGTWNAQPELWQLTMSKQENAGNFLEINVAGHYALFTQHCPHHFKWTLEHDGKELKPVYVHEFDHHHHHHHDEEIYSVGLEEEGAMDIDKLNEWIGYLLQYKGPDIFRMKGILNVYGKEERFVFQGVHMLFDATSDRKWKPGEKRLNQMVFIGKKLNREELREGFQNCKVKEKVYFE
jgi:G3E family GTPase